MNDDTREAVAPPWSDPATVEHYRQMFLAASTAHRQMFAWFLLACVQALIWMGVALWALTR